MPQNEREDSVPDTALAIARARCRLYALACRCAADDTLAAAWRDAERQARRHAGRLAASRDDAVEPAEPAAWTCLIEAMDLALQNGDRAAAQLVAQECIAIAEAHALAAQRRPDGGHEPMPAAREPSGCVIAQAQPA
ncbi:MAG TPA: hypothetical protein VMR06_01705 [Dokdonella sp.]|uniref:hypothetical protein n=1 Tax=Dokdonella sp. TaxID=2291710 RepID=UPI002CFCA2F9|nr:hypothetical protein [Dokdonella sp.]HUD40691.1 hypothetical protein [Dokdonella sp.]